MSGTAQIKCEGGCKDERDGCFGPVRPRMVYKVAHPITINSPGELLNLCDRGVIIKHQAGYGVRDATAEEVMASMTAEKETPNAYGVGQ